jgi:hypothetical protein
MLPMLVAPARDIAPSVLEGMLYELEERLSNAERALAGLLIQLTERPTRRSAPATTRAVPRLQRREVNMHRVSTLRLQHPDWPMRVIAEKCDLKQDYCNQLWRDYRDANGISATRERSR